MIANDRQAFLKEIHKMPEVWGTAENRKKFKESNMARYKKLSRIFDRNGLNHPNVAGRVVALLKELKSPTQQEWENFYRERCAKYNRQGLLTELAWRLWNLGGWEHGSPAHMLAFTVSRVLDETYEGVAYEWIALEMLKEEWGDGYTVRDATDWEEKTHSIDIVVESSEGNMVQAYQVKPDTFFGKYVTPSTNAGLVRDRIKNCNQMYNLAVNLDSFEAVAFLKKSEVMNRNYNPLPISTFNRDGSLNNAM